MGGLRYPARYPASYLCEIWMYFCELNMEEIRHLASALAEFLPSLFEEEDKLLGMMGLTINQLTTFRPTARDYETQNVCDFTFYLFLSTNLSFT
jgi:hypothetical protein